jgi:hypothetical protein
VQRGENEPWIMMFSLPSLCLSPVAMEEGNPEICSFEKPPTP